MTKQEAIELKTGRLKVSIEPSNSSINLYWDGVKLTKEHGLISIIGSDDIRRYYSDKASWCIKGIAANEVWILLKWQDLPVEQHWRIALKDENTIDWKVSLILTRNIAIREQEAGLVLSSDYTRWVTSCEEGVFPRISPQQKEWQDLQLVNVFASSIGVRSCIKDDSYRPAVIFDFRETNEYTESKIRNSHIFVNARGLFSLIKLDGYSTWPINKEHNIFVGKVKLIDNEIALTKHIESCKDEDKKRQKEFRISNQTDIKSYKDLLTYLILRFRNHYYNRGILYAIYRGAKYVTYCVGSGRLLYIWLDIGRFKRGLKYKDADFNLERLELGKLELLINTFRSTLNIYWSGAQLTREPGLITVMGGRSFIFGRHYSNQAFWKVQKFGPNQAIISLNYVGLPVKQEWLITLEDERTIKWDIWISPKRKVIIAEEETGITLSSDYTHWINSYEEGEFLRITPDEKEWREMKFWNLSSKSIGVKGCMQNDEFKPALILDFEETKKDTRPVIRNSDYKTNLRVLLVQTNTHKPLHVYKAGIRHNIFSGKIKIIDDEKLVEQHIINCKKSLYRQRLPFIEEKMTKKYLSNILKPVEVALVNLPWKRDDKWGVRAGSRWPHIKNKEEETYLPFPFFLAYAASVLLEQGVSVRIIDAIAENMDYANFIKLIDEIEPRLIIAEVSTPSLENDLDILKKINRENTKIAVCGLDFNIRQPDFLRKNNFIDFVMVGEYEYTALDLFRHINNGDKLKEVLGIIYKDNGNIKVNSTRPLIEDLDKLPWPLREQLPMEQYMDAPGNIETPSVQMLASRGCPFQCIFCAWPQLMYNSNRYRMRKPEAIVDELEYLIKERKFKSVYFDDDTFNINKKNVLEICREIKQRRLEIPWAIMARADTMDEEILVKMKEAGLYAVKYGVESADQKLLDNAGKNMNLKQAERMIIFTKSLGIKTHLTFTFGLPGETQDTIKRTIDYALELNPATLQFSIMTPYPGTEYYNQLDAKGHIVSKDWSDYDGASKSVIRTEYLSPSDLEKAKDEAMKRWKKYRRARRSFIAMPFDKELKAAFKNNLKSRGLLSTLIKTTKFILNI